MLQRGVTAEAVVKAEELLPYAPSLLLIGSAPKYTSAVVPSGVPGLLGTKLLKSAAAVEFRPFGPLSAAITASRNACDSCKYVLRCSDCPETVALYRKEEEQLVLHNGTAQGSAELVEVQCRASYLILFRKK